MWWQFHRRHKLKKDFTAAETWQTPRGEGGCDAHLSPSDTAFLPWRCQDFTSLALLLEENKHTRPLGSIFLLSPPRRYAWERAEAHQRVGSKPQVGIPLEPGCLPPAVFHSQVCRFFPIPVPWPRAGADVDPQHRGLKSAQLRPHWSPCDAARGVRVSPFLLLRATVTMTPLGHMHVSASALTIFSGSLGFLANQTENHKQKRQREAGKKEAGDRYPRRLVHRGFPWVCACPRCVTMLSGEAATAEKPRV